MRQRVRTRTEVEPLGRPLSYLLGGLCRQSLLRVYTPLFSGFKATPKGKRCLWSKPKQMWSLFARLLIAEERNQQQEQNAQWGRAGRHHGCPENLLAISKFRGSARRCVLFGCLFLLAHADHMLLPNRFNSCLVLPLSGTA